MYNILQYSSLFDRLLHGSSDEKLLIRNVLRSSTNAGIFRRLEDFLEDYPDKITDSELESLRDILGVLRLKAPRE